ncbi:alpha-1A adrenergic receptor-like [Protopterus annectens]|uniref:alpha-1A adrenergic receptor-like n=1 Tax=Protopterus annectens TaxID=7888 RepID=UPI001CF9A680|nr:alpha-1A adrenergic receptor-like [Protopterus annectens]
MISSWDNKTELPVWNSSRAVNHTHGSASPRRAICISLTLGAFILFAIMGNILVILSVACHKHLRIVTNYFIVNLAVADLLLSATVLPFSATLEVLGYWIFGRVFCNIWAAVDVLCCTASILSLCVISVDRYLGVSYPLRYPMIMTKKRGLHTLAGVWALSMVISIGPLLGWKEPEPEDDKVCKITEEPGYALFSALGSFYLPLAVILAMYFRVYLAARRETRSLYSGVKKDKSISKQEAVTLRIHRKSSVKDSPLEKSISRSKSKIMKNSFSIRLLKFSKEKKAAKTLGIVVGVFVLCWLPFFIVLPLGSFFPQYKPPEYIFKVIFWLGYFNSCINPLIYPCFNQEFKRAFKHILKGRFRRKRKQAFSQHQFTYRSCNKGIRTNLENDQEIEHIQLTSNPSHMIYEPCKQDSSEWRFISALQNVHTFNRTTEMTASSISYNGDYLYIRGTDVQSDCLIKEEMLTSPRYEKNCLRSQVHIFTFTNHLNTLEM